LVIQETRFIKACMAMPFLIPPFACCKTVKYKM